MPNIKAIHLAVSEKKNFKVLLLCSYVQICQLIDMILSLKIRQCLSFIRRIKS